VMRHSDVGLQSVARALDGMEIEWHTLIGNVLKASRRTGEHGVCCPTFRQCLLCHGTTVILWTF
jgi:hypothetical protein